MNFNEFFPEQYRAFYNGPLSCCVERFGGVNSISLLDIREFDGKLYPDRFPIPWLRRSGSSMGHPLFGPAIRFMHDAGQYVPRHAELFPFGCRSEEYSLLLSQNAMAFRFAGHPDGEFHILLSTLHMPDGKMPALKNQLAVIASGIQWLPPELRGPGFDPAKPFPENGMELRRSAPTMSADGRNIILAVECTYADHVKKQYMVISAGQPFAIDDIPNGKSCRCQVQAAKELIVAIGFAPDLAEATRHAENLRSNFDAQFQQAAASCRSAMQLEISALPDAAKFFQLHPSYQRYLLLAETAQECAIRAAADKFGFFALWDHVYPIRDFLLSGEPERAAKALRYMFNYPHVESCLWVTMHLIITCNEYLAFTSDDAMLREAMPHFRRYMRFAHDFTDPASGLIKTSLNCGVDNSKQAGLSGLFFASCLNGWWYDACRSLENMAYQVNDIKLAAECADIARRIGENYVKMFFVPSEGYLRAACNADGSHPEIEIYQNTHTLGLDYTHGRYLFRRIMRQLAAYQAKKLYHPLGHTAVAPDSRVPCEMWKNVHMNQHLGHECKLARFSGDSAEALRVMRGYLTWFSHYQCAVETFNLAGCDGDSNQTATWQAFSATAAAQALCCGVAGLAFHRGGLHWVPSQEKHETTLGNFMFRGQKISLHVHGEGAYAHAMTLNGRLICGTMQIPADIACHGETVWEIVREATPPEFPVLLSATDTPIGQVAVRGTALEFVISGATPIHTTLLFAAATRPQLSINGQIVTAEWLDAERQLWFDGQVCGGDRVSVVI